MSLTASDVIEEARDFHRDFVREVFPNKMLLRALSRAEEDLYRAVLAIDDEPLADTYDIDVAEARFSVAYSEPVTLPDFMALLAVEAISDEGEIFTVPLVSSRDDTASHGQLVGELIGRDLRLRVVGRDYTSAEAQELLTDIANVRITYVPLPATLTAVTDELTAPAQARSFLVASLVAFMASRIDLPEAPKLMSRAAELQGSVVQSLTDMAHTAWAVRIVR